MVMYKTHDLDNYEFLLIYLALLLLIALSAPNLSLLNVMFVHLI